MVKMNEINLDGQSKDILSENIFKIKKIFPGVIVDGKIDFEMLKSILGEDIDDSREKYSFTWPGKTQAIRESQKQSNGTLRPCKDESKNWDTTQNLYIEGDNLEVLKLLQKSYYNKIKCIYIDPPYNTGKDFVYKDNYADNLENYLKLSGQLSESKGGTIGVKLTNNPETLGRYHSNWLNMMYPRLKLARNLLTDDGFIFISISDEEVNNLKKVCDEIFGEENYRNTLFVRRYDKNLNLQFAKNGLKSMNIGLEYILIYSKNFNSKFNPVYRKSNDKRSNEGYWKGFWNNADRPTMRYPILGFEPTEGQWKWKKDVAYEAIKNYEEYIENFSDKYTLEEYWIKTGKSKRFIRRSNGTGKNMGVEHWVAPSEGILRNTNWSDILVSKKNNLGIPFDSPKSVDLIMELISLFSEDNDEIILDFFSGSSSTAESVIRFNSKNNSSKKFIMVQIPESTTEKSEAYKEGYETICEIGKERIKRAGDQIIKESNNDNLDIGFKVFKLDSSNLEKWDPDYNNIQQSLTVDQIKKDRTNEDLIYEVMLKYGINLTYPIEQENNIYSIGFGALVICLEDNITKDIVDEILNFTNDSSTSRVVFKDSGFKSDANKTNIKEILKTNYIDEFITI